MTHKPNPQMSFNPSVSIKSVSSTIVSVATPVDDAVNGDHNNFGPSIVNVPFGPETLNLCTEGPDLKIFNSDREKNYFTTEHKIFPTELSLNFN
jgi:hypothetical protein